MMKLQITSLPTSKSPPLLQHIIKLNNSLPASNYSFYISSESRNQYHYRYPYFSITTAPSLHYPHHHYSTNFLNSTTSATIQMEKFRKFDFENHPEWNKYKDNLHIPDGADKEKIVSKYRRKWYERHVEKIPDSESGEMETYTCPFSPLVTESGKSEVSKALLLLHGLGGSGHACVEAAKYLCAQMPGLKVYCPSANTIPVTISFGMRMPAWFNILSASEHGAEDVEGIKQTQKHIHELMDYIVAKDLNGKSENLMIGGLSQGGCVSMLAGLTYDKRLAGIFGLSTFVVGRKSIDYKNIILNGPNLKTPFLQCHGTSDGTVKYEWGQRSHEALKEIRPENVEFKTYQGMGHTISAQEMEDITKWMKGCFKSEESA